MGTSLSVTGRAELSRAFHRVERRNQLRSMALVMPLFLLVFIFFALPIGDMLSRSVDNPEVYTALPTSTQLLANWDGESLPSENIFAAFVSDLRHADEAGEVGALVKRLNYEIQGFRNIINRTLRRLPDNLEPSAQAGLIALDPAWSDVNYWRAIKHASSQWTSLYVLSALDLRIDPATDALIKVDPNHAIYQAILLRTLYISAIVTALCLLMGYPLAYWLTVLPERKSNLLMICVLLPFWTSLIVRTAAWIVLLQTDGLVNRFLQYIGLIDQPIQLVFNRTGVIVAMTHVLLPFMVLPLYSVMKGIPQNYVRAAISLGAHPFVAFMRIYMPQTMAGLAAGCLLTFILAIGYYVTPALIGGAADQMLSYFIAFYTNRTMNWGLASALGSMLLVATLLLYFIYNKLTASSDMSRR